MRKNIIQSKTEPNKNDIWLSEEGLKKYGKNGWEPLGGGSNNSGGGYTDMMVLNTGDNATLTEEQFNEIKARVNANSRFKITFKNQIENLSYICYGIPYDLSEVEEVYVFIPQDTYVSTKDYSYNHDVCFFAIHVNNEYYLLASRSETSEFELPVLRIPTFYYTGDGTKFLSDDGTYKKVSGGSGPVIIDMIGESGSVTDEQIEAAKNGNIKIKVSSEIGITYVLPYYYLVQEDAVIFCVRLGDSDFYDSIFKIDIINKTISAYIKE